MHEPSVGRLCINESHNISNREKEVLELLSYGYTLKEIAHKLHLSIHTIISHKKNLSHKLNAVNIASLIRAGFENEILQTT